MGSLFHLGFKRPQISGSVSTACQRGTGDSHDDVILSTVHAKLEMPAQHSASGMACLHDGMCMAALAAAYDRFLTVSVCEHDDSRLWLILSGSLSFAHSPLSAGHVPLSLECLVDMLQMLESVTLLR
eukprot:scpid78211/ scgid9065/ 